MTFANDLDKLASPGAFPQAADPAVRWGQMIRESSEIAEVLRAGLESGKLVPLRALATVSSGVVTRANAYFIVRELPFDGIPKRFRITKRDYGRVTVIMDGLETPFRIEREYLREIAKGPDSLISPVALKRTDARLVDINRSKEDLRGIRHSDAVAYLKRGETFPYNVSGDKLKGGVPAKRSNIRTRRPYWYTLNAPLVVGPRILVPEHFDKRFVATAVSSENEVVVIDTLYTVTPLNDSFTNAILWSLNSVLGWYQVELRGRTQHGEGVLKVKIPDWRGVLVLNPEALADSDLERLSRLFTPIASSPTLEVADELARPERNRFDAAIALSAGAANPDEFRLLLERELRAAMGERHERSESVSDAKVARSSASKPSASIEAYAARIAASVTPFPDPRVYIASGQHTIPLPIAQPFEGDLTLGDSLFSAGDVLAGDDIVASASGILAAEYVRAALLHDGKLGVVDVPSEPGLDETMSAWKAAVAEWQTTFDVECDKVLKMIADSRMRGEIRNQALRFVHAR